MSRITPQTERKSARLIVTYDCNNNCPGCCNKGWKYEPPEIITHYQFDEILITGGEPLLFLDALESLIRFIRSVSKAKIYIYTASHDYCMFAAMANMVDGMTLTLHNRVDSYEFSVFAPMLEDWLRNYKGSLRLNIFRDAWITPLNCKYFDVKLVRWLKDCPLPPNEKLFKLDPLWSRKDYHGTQR